MTRLRTATAGQVLKNLLNRRYLRIACFSGTGQPKD